MGVVGIHMFGERAVGKERERFGRLFRDGCKEKKKGWRKRDRCLGRTTRG